PKKFRETSKSWVITRGLDGCLFLLPKETFQSELNKINEVGFSKKANRDLVRLMTNEATELVVDSNGRINLPDYLIAYAQLKKAVVIVGSLNRIEIWDLERYHHYLDQLESKAETIAEQAYVAEK
ncbi:MAG TPA: cell division/cell wall cluster transcriptional repressor MraZ, partial [Candidatus Woesebacteria bacterium]|nr:cell division/cell wall cluster transcriptional repressor MraZ [Candidatus Woesebacteria bacterium]